jgi:hypothetical protein
MQETLLSRAIEITRVRFLITAARGWRSADSGQGTIDLPSRVIAPMTSRHPLVLDDQTGDKALNAT